jgi:hypothetical protein
MCGKIRIANLKPGWHSHLFYRPKYIPGFIVPTPASRGVCHSSQGVTHCIQVWRNPESKVGKIICRIHDYGQALWLQNLCQAIGKFCAAHTPG